MPNPNGASGNVIHTFKQLYLSYTLTYTVMHNCLKYKAHYSGYLSI